MLLRARHRPQRVATPSLESLAHKLKFTGQQLDGFWHLLSVRLNRVNSFLIAIMHPRARDSLRARGRCYALGVPFLLPQPFLDDAVSFESAGNALFIISPQNVGQIFRHCCSSFFRKVKGWGGA